MEVEEEVTTIEKQQQQQPRYHLLTRSRSRSDDDYDDEEEYKERQRIPSDASFCTPAAILTNNGTQQHSRSILQFYLLLYLSLSLPPTPSTEQQVQGLSSIISTKRSIHIQDNRTAAAEIEASKREKSEQPQPQILFASSTCDTNFRRYVQFDSLREETLSQLFCYLPLSDPLRTGKLSRR